MWTDRFLFLLLVSLCGAFGYAVKDIRGAYERECDNNDNNTRNCNSTSWSDDDPKYYYEPCDYSDDIDCVQKFFSDYSECSVIHHSDNRPIFRKELTHVMANINSTIISTRDRLINTEGKIVSFYVNKKSNNLIMEVDFKNLTIESKKLYIIVNRRGKEPAVAADYANGTHTFTTTAFIPLHEGKIDMYKTRVTTYVQNGIPPFYFGPKLTNSSDPDITRAVAGIVTNTATAVREYFVTEGLGLFLAYFQKYICDFGIPLSNTLFKELLYSVKTHSAIEESSVHYLN